MWRGPLFRFRSRHRWRAARQIRVFEAVEAVCGRVYRTASSVMCRGRDAGLDPIPYGTAARGRRHSAAVMFLLAVAMAAVFGFTFCSSSSSRYTSRTSRIRCPWRSTRTPWAPRKRWPSRPELSCSSRSTSPPASSLLANAVVLLCVLVIGEIAVVTPRNTLAGFVGSFVAFGAGLVVAQLMPNLRRRRSAAHNQPLLWTGPRRVYII